MSPAFRRPLPLWTLALCGALTLAGCGQKATGGAEAGGKGGKGKGAGGPAPVSVGTVQKKIIPLVVDAIGAVEPIRSTAIRTQITGLLTKIAIREGADVNEGDLLFEIDPRPYRNALLTAEADLQKAKLQLATARTQVDRYKSLTADQMVSKEQFEKIMDTARALEAEVASDEAKVATAKVQLEYCSIRAPLAGRTGNMSVHEGDLVRANANDATSVLMTINQLSPIYVTFSVPQQYLGTLTRYRSAGTLQVRAVPPGADEKPEDGTLTFMDNMVDASTGTLKLKGTFLNDRHRLWPGQFVTVTVTLSSPEVLTVAASAIQNAQNGQHVFIVKDGVADIRPVMVERTYEADAVIAKGLEEGETVVTDGQLRVIPKKPVEIKDGNPGAGTAKGGKGGGEGKKKEKKEKKRQDI